MNARLLSISVEEVAEILRLEELELWRARFRAIGEQQAATWAAMTDDEQRERMDDWAGEPEAERE